MTLWTIDVVFRADNQVEFRVDKDGHSMHPAGQRSLSLAVMLDQLEAWLDATGEGVHIALAIWSPNGQSRVMATRRWSVAIYFILAAYERVFAGLSSAPTAKATSLPPSGGEATSEGEEPRATRLQSGPVSTAAARARNSTRNGTEP